MKTLNSHRFLSPTAIGWAVGAVLLTFSVPEGSSQTPSASANGKKDLKRRFDLQIDLILTKGDEFDVDQRVATLFKRIGSNGRWTCKGKGARRRKDSTLHTFAVSVDGKKDVYLVYKPADQSYTLNWLTDGDGRLLATVLTDSAGVTREVSNTAYEPQFELEKAYWDGLSPAPAATISPPNKTSTP